MSRSQPIFKQVPAGGGGAGAARNLGGPLEGEASKRTVLLTGVVCPGFGVARDHVRAHCAELRDLTGEQLVHGSLNVVLRHPVQLSLAEALPFDEQRRLVWRARIRGMPVWIYRWRSAPLHVLEILAATHLRSELGLRDGDELTVEIDAEIMTRIRLPARLAWSLFWYGRQDWYYKHRRYSRTAERWCKLFGANQSSQTVRSLVKARLKRNAMLAKARSLIPFARRGTDRYRFERLGYDEGVDPVRRVQLQVRNVLNYTKTSGTSYSAQLYPAGYHSIEVHGEVLKGQRDPALRLARVPFDFTGKSVLDIGCNQGGMLFQLDSKLKWGVGIDYDHRMINAANRLRSVRRSAHLDFFVFDLEKEPLDLIRDFLPDTRVDIVFLLSVCMWLRNWREVLGFASGLSSSMLFESNGSAEQQAQQHEELLRRYGKVTRIAASSEDDPRQRNRKLYLCELPGHGS